MPERSPSPIFRPLDQARSQGVALDVPADHEEVLIVLDRKTLVSLLVDVPHTACVVMRMIPHRVGSADPRHESTHFTIDQRPQNQVVMIGHQLKRIQLDLMNLQRFMQDSLKRGVVGLFVENGRSQVSSIERVVQTARFVGTWWSGHGKILQKVTFATV